MADALKKLGYSVRASDIIKRTPTTEVYDFLWIGNTSWDGDIITNPPYSMATEFVMKSLQIIPEGNKVAMLLKITFLESNQRREFFRKYPPKTVYVFSDRIKCGKNGDFSSTGHSAVCYAWFVWVKGFKGDPVIKWVN